MKRIDGIAVLVLAGLTAALAPLTLSAQESALGKRKEQADRLKCANQLRQLGLAAITYADDKRFFPHMGRLIHLDGDVNTNHAPKVVRTLRWYGYHDNLEGFICPSSNDEALPVRRDIARQPRRWFWGQKYDQASTELSPIVHGDDPKLAETRELSYGWTRKGMNCNVRSTALLGADRAARLEGAPGMASEDLLVGNHVRGWNVLKADAMVDWRPAVVTEEPFLGELLVRTKRGGGYLGLKPQTDPAAFKTR